jgi:hypothetical protein
MKYFYLFLSLVIFSSCTKEVKIDIPGYQQQLVVDGNIEAGGHPVVLLSKSADIYSQGYLSEYVQSFVADANVRVVVDGDTFQLEYKLFTDFPLSTQKKFAEMLRVELDEAQALPINIYSSFDLIGEAGKSYELVIDHSGKRYSGSTYLPLPTALQELYWKLEPETGEYGYAHAKLADPANQFDAYKWESKRINTTSAGTPLDLVFKRGNGGGSHFSDEFFDGLTIDLSYGNPQKKKDSSIVTQYKRYFRYGDSVVVKFSKLDKKTFDFYKAKASQIENTGNPFATPINIPTNIKGGALGIWAGYSPTFDTLICVE